MEGVKGVSEATKTFPCDVEEVSWTSEAIETFSGDVGGVKCFSEVIETFPGDLEGLGCVSEVIETFPGDLEGLGCVSEAIETFPGDLEGLGCVSEAIETFPGDLEEGINWLGVNAASILIIASCVNSMNSSASQISSSIWSSLTTARISSSNFRIVSSFSCSRSFCCRNRVIMADGWSCSSRVSKISSTDEIIFLVDTLWPVRTFRFLASFPEMKIDAINPWKIQIKTSRNSRLSRSIRF